MSTERRPAHSPLGGSGAERWMNCVGSVALLKELKLPESDEPDYRSEGTTAHAAAYACLTQDMDAWEVINQQFEKHTVNIEMANAVQVYLDDCRRIEKENPGGTVYNEFSIDYPEFHDLFYGTLDRAYLLHGTAWIHDYKHGAGIAVDVEWNPQFMYYAFGILRLHPEIERVVISVVQPRAFHPDGKIRTWECSADTIRQWANEKLRPAMLATAVDNDLDAGAWCRFCPAKLVCPLMWNLFGAAMQTDPKQVVTLSDELLSKSYHYLDALAFFVKAFKEETYRRLNNGQQIQGIKLVNQKANRVWKAGAKEALLPVLGQDIYTEPEMKTPAQVEKLGEAAKALAQSWAYKPDTGLTVATEDDKRPAVIVRSTEATFSDAVSKLATT
jgi:hypothetical protein